MVWATRALVLSCAACVPLWIAGCGGNGASGGADSGPADAAPRPVDAEPPCTGSAPFAAGVQPIFDAHCTGGACHDADQPAAGVDLTAGSSYAALVGVPSGECAGRTLVVPGSPAESYLYDKVTGGNFCAGSAMPKGAPPLSAADLGTLRTWICTGAADD